MQHTLLLVAWQAVFAAGNQVSLPHTSPTPQNRLLHLSQSISCSPRRYCSKSIFSCQDAYWLFRNCSWGRSLDRDNDGVTCENLCSGG